jgi:hypothetical protein
LIAYATKPENHSSTLPYHDARTLAGENPDVISDLGLLVSNLERLLEIINRREVAGTGPDQQQYLSIKEIALRWRVSRGTVYNRLRRCGAKVLDFAAPGKKSRKVVHIDVVRQIEERKTKRLC